jgi:hypothetical protein
LYDPMLVNLLSMYFAYSIFIFPMTFSSSAEAGGGLRGGGI